MLTCLSTSKVQKVLIILASPVLSSSSCESYLARLSVLTHRLAVGDLVVHGVTNLGLDQLVVVDSSGGHLHLDVSAIIHLLHGGAAGGGLRLLTVSPGLRCCQLLGLLLPDPLILLFLLLPLLLPDLGFHLRPEVVDHLLLVLPVHVEERGGRVVSRPGSDMKSLLSVMKTEAVQCIAAILEDLSSCRMCGAKRPQVGDQMNSQIVEQNSIIIQLTSELQDNLPSKVEFWY